jgi:hypothetical protein
VDARRRARRGVWAFRLIFYPGAVILALLALTNRGHIHPAETSLQLAGHTDQRRQFGFGLDKRMRPLWFVTEFVYSCAGERLSTWSVPRGGKVPWRFDDPTLNVRQADDIHYNDGHTADAVLTLQAQVGDGGRTVTGTMRLTAQMESPEGPRYPCDSGPVSFSATADG